MPRREQLRVAAAARESHRRENHPPTTSEATRKTGPMTCSGTSGDAEREEHDRVDEHLALGARDAVHVGQHRDAGFVRSRSRSSERVPRSAAASRGRSIANRTSAGAPIVPGHRRPADERRHRAGGSADDDVLRRPPLEPHRVDEDVVQRCRRATATRPAGSREVQQHERAGTEQPCANASARFGAIVPSGSGRPIVRCISSSMSAVVDAVERSGRSRRERAADAASRTSARAAEPRARPSSSPPAS